MVNEHKLEAHECGSHSFSLPELADLPYKHPTSSVLRKRMEIELVQIVEKYKNQGLDLAYITIDLSQQKVIDARVTLNEATDISEQATDLNPTNQST